MDVGIGINSGVVCVGNTGTTRCFKYGPVGNTVNLASRIQGASEYRRGPLTQATRDQLGPEFSLRRLACLQVVNIHRPVAVYGTGAGGRTGVGPIEGRLRKSCRRSEAGPLQEAAMILGGLVTSFGLNGPSLFLLLCILGAMQDRTAWSSVCVLPGK